MTPQIIRVLRKLYKYDNREYDSAHGVSFYKEETLSEKERALLSQYGWQANAIERFDGHDDVLTKLHGLKTEPALNRKRCIDAFIAGVGGSYPRGRSVLAAFHKLHSLPLHAYYEKTQFRCCWVCSDKNEPQYENDGYLQYCLYLGNAYAGTPSDAYLNLKHLLNMSPVTPTEADRIVFNQLIGLLRISPDDETPGRFEKRLTASKILSGDTYTKRGIMQTLALLGVVPNQYISLSLEQWNNFGDVAGCEKALSNTKGRSDMEMPWAGWLGRLKVDEEKVNAYFGDYLD